MSAGTDARTSVIYECPECETRYLDEAPLPGLQPLHPPNRPGRLMPTLRRTRGPSRPDLTPLTTKETEMTHT